ncbi:hypothetical protein F4821DRAFT_233268 [Hypoxylon rubiginosum]|uniref:Uncharacterized protein n=1 Tax=Hypoxylon rubiginosum TaxID=110542 RepID=A0ACC0D7M7_9PEZI|nr:hypothetical protein F4821DRAFT_233268 [Hypoxylon rubiginosum]
MVLLMIWSFGAFLLACIGGTRIGRRNSTHIHAHTQRYGITGPPSNPVSPWLLDAIHDVQLCSLGAAYWWANRVVLHGPA